MAVIRNGYDPAAQIAAATQAANAYQQMQNAYAQQREKNAAEAAALQAQQPVQNTSSNPSMLSLLQQSYQNSLANNQTQYNNTLAAMQAAYDSSAARVDKSAQDALRNAYISRMQTQRDMPQQLSAMGLSGGMAETTAAKLANNYANNRASIENSRLEQLGALNDSLLQSRYQAANQLAERNAADAQNYYEQLAAQAAAGTSSSNYNYKTDPAYIEMLQKIYNGDENYDTLRMKYQTLALQHSVDGADALLKAALNM